MYVRTTNLPSICLAVYAFRLLASVAAVVFPTPLQVRRTNACQRHYFRGHLVSVPHVRLYAWGIPHCQTVGRQRCCPIAYLCLRQTSAFRSFRSSTDGLSWCAVHLPCRCQVPSAHIFMLWQYTLLACFVCLHFDFLCTLARPFTTQLLVTHVFHIWPGIPLLHLMWKFLS